MSKLNITLSLFVLTLMWGSVGYDAGIDAPNMEADGGDLLRFGFALIFTIAFGLRVWRALTVEDEA